MAERKKENGGLTSHLCEEVLRLTAAVAGPLPDQEMDDGVETLFAATTRLAHAPAWDPSELMMKLDILCRRLREHLDPDNRGAVLTSLLAESIRDDLSLLIGTNAGTEQPGGS